MEDTFSAGSASAAPTAPVAAMDTFCFWVERPVGVIAVVGTDLSITSSSVSEQDPAEHAEGTSIVAGARAGVSRTVVDKVGAFRVGPGMVWMAAAADAIVTGSVGTRLCVSSLSSRPRPHRGPIVAVTVCLLPRFLSLPNIIFEYNTVFTYRRVHR